MSTNLTRRSPYLRWFALCVLMLWPARADAQRIRPDSLRATRIQAVHRDGQTFLSWLDADTANVRGYRILRHSEPITDENAARADVIADSVGAGTGLDYIHQAIFKQPRGFVITDLGSPLLPGQGLYVHTAKRNRSSCYAVVSLGPDGRPVGTGAGARESEGNVVLPPRQPIFHLGRAREWLYPAVLGVAAMVPVAGLGFALWWRRRRRRRAAARAASAPRAAASAEPTTAPPGVLACI